MAEERETGPSSKAQRLARKARHITPCADHVTASPPADRPARRTWGQARKACTAYANAGAEAMLEMA